MKEKILLPNIDVTEDKIEIKISIKKYNNDENVLNSILKRLNEIEIDNTIENRYTFEENSRVIRSTIHMQIDITSCIQLEEVKTFILTFKWFELVSLSINGNEYDNLEPFFTALYVLILKTHKKARLGYDTECCLPGRKITHMIEYSNDKYITFNRYYHECQGEYLWQDDYDVLEVKEDQIIKEIYKHILKIIIC